MTFNITIHVLSVNKILTNICLISIFLTISPKNKNKYIFGRMKAITALPLRVSPLIKLSRWVFLISGICYGIVNHKKYSILAANFREEEKKMKILRDEQFAREEALRNQETARDLAEALTGLRVRFEKALGAEDDDINSAVDSTPSDEVLSDEDVK